MKTKIKEIFTSIQGEGPYVGYKQLFVRFCGCNLNCAYCDTDFVGGKEYTSSELLDICKQNNDCHSVALTGGEPLLDSVFLQEFLPDCSLPVYLETNGTLVDELSLVIDYVDYVSADIKLPSCTSLNPLWDVHDKFFSIANTKNLFAKVVFDSNITEYEILKSSKLASKYNIELIIQPKMDGDKLSVTPLFMTEILDRFVKLYPKTRLIPQTHKFLSVE